VQARVHDHAQRLVRGGHEPHVQPRVVLEHGADAREHGAGAPARGVAVGARGRARDPLARAVRQGGAAVQRGGGLHPHPGPAALHAREADVDLVQARASSPSANSTGTPAARSPHAAAVDLRKRVGHAHHHARQPGGHERIGAGRVRRWRRRPSVTQGGGAAGVRPGFPAGLQGRRLAGGRARAPAWRRAIRN
jgi:hypothetical protein